MKLFAVIVWYKVPGVGPKKLSAAYDLSSFGFFQRSRFVTSIQLIIFVDSFGCKTMAFSFELASTIPFVIALIE